MANPLSLWNVQHQKQLQETISCAKQHKTPFAVFDADNTIWKHDLTECLLAWLEKRGLISLDRFETTLLPIPSRPRESIYGYYIRLGQLMGHSASYLWSAQAFQGLELNQLRMEISDMMKSTEAMNVSVYEDEKLVFHPVSIPQIFPFQKELIAELQRNGIAVWVVSASLEELVRMVVSDPEYGIDIPPERVIGVNMLIRTKKEEIWTSAQHRERGMKGDEFFDKDRLSGILTHHIYAPVTWYAGKVAAIQEWIHPTIRPLLVAGDSPNDFYMQFYANAMAGGTRLRIHRTDSHKEKLHAAIERRLGSKSAHFDPAMGWLEVSF